MYLIIYDIQKDHSRIKVSKHLEKEGYNRIQLSVFIGTEDPNANSSLWSYLSDCCDENTDKLFVLSISSYLFKQMKYIGKLNWDIDFLLGEKKELFI